MFTLSAVSQALVQKIETEKDNTTIVVRISQQQEGNNNYLRKHGKIRVKGASKNRFTKQEI